MKNTILGAAIVATAAIATSQAYAGMLSINSYGAKGNQQFHHVSHNGSLYYKEDGSQTAQNVESQTLRIHFRSAQEGTTNRNLDCGEPVINQTEGLEESWRADQVNTYLTLATGGGQTTETGVVKNSPICDIDIGPQGEVLGGAVLNGPVTYPGITGEVHSVVIMTPPRRTIAYVGDSCDVGVNAIGMDTAKKTNDLYDQLLNDNGVVLANELDGAGAPDKPAGCDTLGITKVVLGQCDPLMANSNVCIADVAKAVPVPAFAAAALGLGLLGITYLSGRRRR